MNTRYAIPPLLAASLACLSGTAGAVDIYGGNGIGYSNGSVNQATGAYSPGPWVANMDFYKADVNAGTEAVIKTGDNITPGPQAQAAATGGLTLIVPPTKSMAWCDPVSNPDVPNNTDINECYGWGMHSKWVVVNLNDLQKRGLTSIWVSITAKRYDDGVEMEMDANGKMLPSDDDLVPALTVFQGRQDEGVHLHWYPNKFQKNPFWAWKLSPFTGGTTQSNGWSTGYFAQGNLDYANVIGRVKLKPGGQNYLTVAVGGDARHLSASEKHDVNFQLAVQLSRKKPNPPGSNGSDGGGSGGGKLDKCGCEIGVTEWHPSMNHCMSIAQCEPIANTADHCKTPEQCERDGGR